jgi:cytochrome oxidase Cu insertion factor (SCO1/SenC/PrrC family)
MRKTLILLTLALIIVTSIVIGFTKDRTNQRNALPADSGQGEASIGGDFTLTDTQGRTVKDADFRGRVMMVFFGFTHCPDICPVTISTISKVMEGLPQEKTAQLAPLFVTVDPQRDTPEVMAAFLENMDKRVTGLTGTPEQIKQVASAYRAYYAKNAATVKEDGDNYTVDHSGFIYLMDKDGTFLKAIPYNTSPQDMTALITPHLD